MRVLVTGGAGFIGSHVADALLASGAQVAILDDLSSGRERNAPAGARLVVGDIRDADAVESLFASFRPQVVCHQAAQTSVSVSTREPVRDADVNVLGSLRVMDACVRHGVERLVFASTGGAIYGEVAEGERAEVGWKEQPISPYGCAKLAVEAYLGAFRHEHGLCMTVLRYANVYGPRQDPHGEAGVVAIFTERMLAGRPVSVFAMRDEGDDGCVRDYVYVADVVHANLAAVRGELDAGVVNVGSGVGTTTLALAEAIAAAAGVQTPFGRGPRRPGDLERSVLEPSSALPTPTPLDAGLTETVAWFRSVRG